jgi:hypothetical protein
MTTQANLYANSILSFHPTAVWTLDENLEDADVAILDNFFPETSVTIPGLTPYPVVNGITQFDPVEAVYENILGQGFYPGGLVKFPNSKTHTGRYVVDSITSPNYIKIVNNATGITLTLPEDETMVSAHNGKVIPAYNSEQYPAFIYDSENFEKKMPLVFGSDSSRKGSILIPSLGLLSTYGKYNNYTLEFWVRINRPENSSQYKLVSNFIKGGYQDDDLAGLYFNEDSFVLRIGDNVGSAYIKEFDKPIFVQIVYSSRSVSLVVNAEKLITLNLTEENISSMAKIDLTTQEFQPYISLQYGIFDAIAIYPYTVTSNQSKARYALGQAVFMPDKFKEEMIMSVDFKSANYSSGFKYPSNATWTEGVSNGLSISEYSISNYKYNKPKRNVKNLNSQVTESDMIAAILEPDWSNFEYYFNPKKVTNTIMNFDFGSLNILKEKVSAFYVEGIRPSSGWRNFGTDPVPVDFGEQTVFKIVNKYDRNHFRIVLDKQQGTGTSLKFYLKYNTLEEIEIEDARILSPEVKTYDVFSASADNFIIGINIDLFCKTFGNNLSAFFSKRDQLTVFALGDNDIDLDKTLSMWVRSINFMSSEDMQRKGSFLTRDSSSGILLPTSNSFNPSHPDYAEKVFPVAYRHYALPQSDFYYSSIYGPTTIFPRMSISTYGYWKDDLPISRLMKSTDGISEEKIDYFQYNVDFGSPTSTKDSQYMNTYSMRPGRAVTTTFPKSVRTYITFEEVSDTYKPDSHFTTTLKMPKDRVVKPGTDWATTKYEVVDASIIYMPPAENLKDLSIVFHIDFDISDIEQKTISIKNLEVASQSLNESKDTPISTKYGTNIIPYVYTLNSGNRVYKYDGYNPVILDKKTSPPLHLEKNSGIRMVGFDKPVSGEYRGLGIKINENKEISYRVGSMQMFAYYESFYDGDATWMQYPDNPFDLGAPFPSSETDILSIKTKDRTITFTIVPQDKFDDEIISGDISRKAKIVATNDKNDIIDENIVYYINGIEQDVPIIETNEWTSIGIAFINSLNFDGIESMLEFTSPMAIDNVSIHRYRGRQIFDSTVAMPWQNVLQAVGADQEYDWEFWTKSKWVDMLRYLDPNKPAEDMENVYKIYTGRNISLPILDGQYKAKILNPAYTWYSDYKSSKYTYTPV